jgi:hypothetical protein
MNAPHHERSPAAYGKDPVHRVTSIAFVHEAGHHLALRGQVLLSLEVAVLSQFQGIWPLPAHGAVLTERQSQLSSCGRLGGVGAGAARAA